MCDIIKIKRLVTYMLVKCPECKKEISDKSDKCIYCGFPMKTDFNQEYSIINGKQYNFNYIIEKVKAASTQAIGCRIISDFLDESIALKDIKALYDIIKLTGKAPNEYNCEFSQKIMPLNLNIPKCPTCDSTNIRKISTTAKAVNTVAFGLLGTKRHKTFRCNDCGYEW